MGTLASARGHCATTSVCSPWACRTCPTNPQSSSTAPGATRCACVSAWHAAAPPCALKSFHGSPVGTPGTQVYNTRSCRHRNIDGAYFGTTFAHLFLLSCPDLRPSAPLERYVPRIYGFKIHPSAYAYVEKQVCNARVPRDIPGRPGGMREVAQAPARREASPFLLGSNRYILYSRGLSHSPNVFVPSPAFSLCTGAAAAQEAEPRPQRTCTACGATFPSAGTLTRSHCFGCRGGRAGKSTETRPPCASAQTRWAAVAYLRAKGDGIVY